MSAKWVAEALSYRNRNAAQCYRSRRADSTVAKWDSATLRGVRRGGPPASSRLHKKIVTQQREMLAVHLVATLRE